MTLHEWEVPGRRCGRGAIDRGARRASPQSMTRSVLLLVLRISVLQVEIEPEDGFDAGASCSAIKYQPLYSSGLGGTRASVRPRSHRSRSASRIPDDEEAIGLSKYTCAVTCISKNTNAFTCMYTHMYVFVKNKHVHSRIRAC